MQLPTLLCIKVQSLKMQLYMGFCYIPPKHWDYFWGQQKIMSQNSRQGRKRCRLPKFLCMKIQSLRIQMFNVYGFLLYPQKFGIIFGGQNMMLQ